MEHNFHISVLIKRITSALDNLQSLLFCDISDNERYFFENVQSELFLNLSKLIKEQRKIDKESLTIIHLNTSDLISVIPDRRNH